MNEDVFLTKVIPYNFWKQHLRFRVSQALFSSNDIDIGTKFLLRSIVETAYKSPDKILDMGCGYGPLGLTLKSLFPNSVVHMVDRDALAVDYSRQNALLNGLSNVEVYGGLGYDDLKTTRFDLIASNIPAKAGDTAITYFLSEAAYYLAAGGIAAVVVIKPLEQLVEKILTSIPSYEILLKRTRTGHTVFHFQLMGEPPKQRPDRSALERGVYDRTEKMFAVGNLKYPARTAYGLPEFDTPGYDTQLTERVLRGLKKRSCKNIAIFNPGQGHLGVIAHKLLRPEKIVLVDRDLLALRYSRINLSMNDFNSENVQLYHQSGLEIPVEARDFFVIKLREENREANRMIVEQAADSLGRDGAILVSASSTAATRLVDDMEGRLKVIENERWRGNCVLVLVK